MSVVEWLLRRERAVVAAGLAALTVLAWLYLWRGAGMEMGGLDMTSVALFPHLQAEPMPGASPADGNVIAGPLPFPNRRRRRRRRRRAPSAAPRD